MESAKIKIYVAKAFVCISVIFISWFVTGRRYAHQNQEYGDIVKAIQKNTFDNVCEIKLDVKTEWPFGWSPASMELSISKNGNTVNTATSKFFKPDRIQQTNGNYYYYFHWSRSSQDKILESYLELELASNKQLKWIKVSECPPLKQIETLRNTKKGCTQEKKTVIKCT